MDPLQVRLSTYSAKSLQVVGVMKVQVHYDSYTGPHFTVGGEWEWSHTARTRLVTRYMAQLAKPWGHMYPKEIANTVYIQSIL